MRALAASVVMLTLSVPAIAADETFRDWTTTWGDDGCRTYTSTEIRRYRDQQEPNLLLLEIDERGDVVVSSLVSWQKFREFYTLNPPTELRRNDTRYVAEKYFFDTDRPATLRVDSETIIEMSPADGGHLVADVSPELINAFQDGLETTVTGKGFCAAPGCESQMLTFSLLGFTKAYAARINEGDVPEENGGDDSDPQSVVTTALPGNEFGIERAHLRVMDNPRGEGAFVYVPRAEIAGYDRYFVWFVNGDQAVALNGPTITATPDLPRPRDLTYQYWQGTGLSESDVTDRALAIVYGK